MRSLAVVAALAAAACSSRPRPDAPGGGPGAPPPDGVAAAPDAAAAAPAPLTRAECEALIDHILALTVAARRAEGQPDPHPDDLARARAGLLDELLGQCLVWDRGSFECLMASEDLERVEACAEQAPGA